MTERQLMNMKQDEAKLKEQSEVYEFSNEVYQQCVDKGWSVADFGLFTQLLIIRKESAINQVRAQIDQSPLPSDWRAGF